MDDISPKLLKLIQDSFSEKTTASEALEMLLNKIAHGKATYIDAGDYAYELGSLLAQAFGENLSSKVLPDGKMYFNIAENVVRPMLTKDYNTISTATAQVQKALNDTAGIGIKAQSAPLNTDRIDGIIDKISNAEKFDDVAWVLDDPVKNFSQSIVDDTIKANAEFHAKAGLVAKIIRKAESHCCKWCSQLEGVYIAPDIPKDVYRRHERCRCLVEYDPGDGKRKTLHSVGDKAQLAQQERAKKERLKKYNALSEAEKKKYDEKASARAKFAAKSEPQNVMAEYVKNAKPGKGTITYAPKYDVERHASEIKTAQWLHDNLGGDIVLLNEINEYKKKTADYLWREKLWDLKISSSETSANAALRHGLKQVENNPGGIILDFQDRSFSMQTLRSVIDKRMQWFTPESHVDILILSNDEIAAALRY